MNYLAHGYQFTGDPYFLAGCAVPDWLSAVDRGVRVREKNAEPFANDDDFQAAAIARGILQHHQDDEWFHRTRAFAELSLSFTASLRDRLDQERGFRPSFLGHILVELLLDCVLAEEEPQRLEAYYCAMNQVNPAVVQHAVNRMSAKSTEALAWFIPRFCRERFLYDYAENAKLLWRLNMVMKRVGFPILPERLLSWLPEARAAVTDRRRELLPR